MRFCELRQKEVINCCDCERLGYVCDVIFDPCTGCIEKIIVPGPCRIWGFLGHDQEYVIPFRCVCKIGPDVILVDINAKELLFPCKLEL